MTTFSDADVAHVTLAFRLRSAPKFERRYLICWWIEEVHRDKSDDAKRTLADSLESAFDEWSRQWLDLEDQMRESAWSAS